MSLANAISARAQQSSATLNNPTKAATAATGDFASEEMRSHFEGLMSILHLLLSLPTISAGSDRDGQDGHSVPPDLVRRGLRVLEASHRGGGLFRFQPFVSRWLGPLLTDALRGLAEGAHPLLQEEVRHLVFDVAEVG